MKKYKTIIYYGISAITSFLIDQITFRILFKLGLAITLATYIARAISSVYNYLINKHKVFNYQKDRKDRTAIWYFLLVIINATASGLLVTYVYDKISIDASIIKIIVDCLIFIINYYIQKKIIFKNNIK